MFRFTLRRPATLAVVALALTSVGVHATGNQNGALSSAAVRSEPTRSVPAATALHWVDSAGRKYGPQDLAAASATVFIHSSTICPCVERYNGRLADLSESFGAKGVRFFLVFSEEKLSGTDADACARRRKLTMPVVLDPRAELADRFEAKATPTAVVVDRDGRIRYRGAIDDNPDVQAVVKRHLRDALTSVLAGKQVAAARTTAVGCAIQGKDASAGLNTRPVLEEGLGRVDFPITTASRQAQRFFNQAMARWYGFNFPEAERNFREVLRLDPSCAMGYWGIALSLGMTYNFDFDPTRLPEATEALSKAQSLADRVKPREQALIRALAIRHAPGKEMLKQLDAYRDAMARVYYDYPQDVHISTLYAASIMDLRPWALWSPDGQPMPGTMEAILVLEDTLRRDGDHIGAHHYLIHATEASPTPERARPSALKLGKLAPRSGHLVHMPAHTFFRIGEYAGSNGHNRRAADIDAEYFTEAGKPTAYGGYYVHNLDFLIAGYTMQGRAEDSIAAAREMARVTSQWAAEMTAINCGSVSGLMAVLARFNRWDDILNAPLAPAENPFTTAMWRYARGMAFLGKGDLSGAERELAILQQAGPAAEKAVPQIPIPGFTDGFIGTFRIARLHLAGKVALARGETDRGLALLGEAIQAEDAIPYIEPPFWRHPVRETLGAALLRLNRPMDAEKTFREALAKHPRSGRALFGLSESLKRLGKSAEQSEVAGEFKKVWSEADTTLRLEDL